jgi:uncharacterized FAD-dependent dehydrogenase
VVGVELADGSSVAASRVVLAVGHSARDMYAHLADLGVALAPKNFAMGFRIEHPQAVIDAIQYGARDAAAEVLRGKGPFPVAEYRLAAEIPAGRLPQAGWAAPEAWYAPLYADAASGLAPAAAQQGGGRGVYSFCMCPGGQIVPTAARPHELCINGMSFSRRNSQWANSALVATVSAADWAHHVPRHGALAGVELQRDVERRAGRSLALHAYARVSWGNSSR